MGLFQSGPTFDIEITVPSALEHQLIAKGIVVPPPVKGQALIDTGATFSAVDESIMETLGIPPVGMIQSGTAGGKYTLNQYPAKLTFINIGELSLSFEPMRATGANLTGQPYIALIGRDVLTGIILVYNGSLGVVNIGY